MPSYTIQLSEKALDDLLDGALYYDNQLSGLGDDFLDAIDVVLERISSNPYACQEILAPYRRVIENKFKYNIIYRIEDNILSIVVISIQHAARHPFRWESRIE